MTSSAVLFAAAISARVGRGHLNRCIAISDTLQRRGIVTALYDSANDFLDMDARIGIDLLRGEEDVRRFMMAHTDRLVFLDDYSFRAGAPSIPGADSDTRFAMLDDFDEMPERVDRLFRLTRSGGAENLAGNPAVIAGEHLAPLRPTFFAARRHRKADGSLLICLGTSELGKSATRQILTMLTDLTCGRSLIVAAPYAETKARQLEKDFDRLNMQVLSTVTDLSPLMARASKAICTPSVTSYELATLGVPLFAVQIADNQARLGQHIQRNNAAQLVVPETDAPEDMAQKLGAFLGADPSSVVTSRLRVDGLGARRIARHLHHELSGKQAPPVRLEIATDEDLEPLFRLQCMPEIRAHARNPEAPSLEEHATWFRAMMADPAREFFLMMVDQSMAGFIRIDRLQDGFGAGPDHYEISIAVDPAFWGQGLASDALDYLFDLLPDDVFIAHVLPENDRSHGLFRRAGFAWRDNRYERLPSVAVEKSGLEAGS